MLKRTNSWSITHGKSNTPTYAIWASMKHRCKAKGYNRYAGRGIVVCQGWMSFENFLSDMHECPIGKSIERLDNNGGYWCGHCDECITKNWPSNCEWRTPKEQSNNRGNNKRITANGLTLTQAQWAKRQGTSVSGIRIRLNSGWSEEAAVLTPVLSKVERMTRLHAGHNAWRQHAIQLNQGAKDL